MTHAEVATMLRGFVQEFRLDPHDAGLVMERVGAEGVDAETLGDYLDGVGYPELATVAYAVPS